MLPVSQIIKLYKEGSSIGSLAKKFNTYPNKIYTILKDNNIPIRSKSEAQSLNIKLGKVQHPTKGKPVSEDTKNLLAQRIYNQWKNLSVEDRQKRKDRSKKQWDNLSKQEQTDFQKKSNKKIRQAATEGSKLEKFLISELTKNGYMAVHHRKQFLPNSKLEVDILLPDIKVVIEIDGPTHYLPVYGPERLEKTQKSDQEKNGLLLKLGYVVFRLRYRSRHFSNIHKQHILSKILPMLSNIKTEFPPPNERLHILEFIYQE